MAPVASDLCDGEKDCGIAHTEKDGQDLTQAS